MNQLIDPTTLASEVDGPVLLPGDDGYAAESATWNLSLAHHPVVVVGATSVADVRAAVRFANEHNRPVAVVTTGHGAVVSADDAVLISLRRMTDVRVDAENATAEVGGGATWQQVVEQAAKAGLAPLVGSAPGVGVVGYTLGGGLSPVLGRRYGFAADHVRSIELVTADGELRHVDALHEPDLFWALRGGKGNFGVVTRLVFDLVPVPHIYGGGLFFDGEHVREALEAFRRLTAVAPDELSLSVAFLRLPDLPFVPEPLRERFTVHVRVAYLGDPEDGERLVGSLRAVAPRIIDMVGVLPFTEAGTIHNDPVDPLPTYEQAQMLRDFPEEAADALVAAVGPDVEIPLLLVEIRQLGGALALAPAVPNAVGHRDARYQLFVGTVGAPGMRDEIRPALDVAMEALRPWATGAVQINFLSAYDTSPARAYEPRTYARLVELKGRYDPKNLFRVNHNIRPDTVDMGSMPSVTTEPVRATDRPGDVSPFALGLLLRRAHWRAAAVMGESLRPFGLELRHFSVLMELVNNGPTVQRDLAPATGTDKAGIMRVVDDLERKGLAVRKAVPGDRRARAVEVTPAGLDLYDAAHVAAGPLSERLADVLEPAERDQLMGLLTKLAHSS